MIGVMKMTGDKEEDQGILHERMVLLLLEEIIAKYHMGCLLESYKRSPFIVFQFSEKNQENWKDLLKEYVEIIVQNFFLYTNKKVYMGISSAFSDLQEIPERYRQAEEASEMRFYDEESSTFWAEDICWKAHVPGMMFSDESLLDEGGMEIFCQELSAYLQQCFSERVSVKTVKENLNRSVNMLIYSVLKAYIRDKETIQEWSSNVSFYEDLQKIATMNELKEKTIHCVERFREKLLDQLNDDYFQDIFRFIDEKLSEDLSLEDMADFNQQSVSAFSKKFKEKTKMDAQKFYKKWIYDIADCQDSVSGHVQYTAPYIPSGGGPGGWGCAIVTVPYTYYKNYGDAEILKELYPQMLHWLDYMENHSENNLVVSDHEGEWCLGDWCVPTMGFVNNMDAIYIPAPLVNTYFYIKSMQIVLEIGNVIGRHEADEEIRQKIERKKQALVDVFFDPETGDFAENQQGSNVFAVDLGIG